MTKYASKIKFGLLGLVVCTVLLSITFLPVQANPQISGEFISTFAVEPSEPYSISAQQDLLLALEQNFGDSSMYIGIKGEHQWPKQKDAQQWSLDLDEAYLDYYGADFDVRFGKQRFNWGTAMQINPTSVLNPVNINDPLGEKLPVYALSADYYIDNTFKVTGVYLPFFKPALDVDKMQMPGMPGMDPVIVTVTRPEPTLKNGQFALKLSAMGLGGADFSASYFRGKEDLPTPIMGVMPPQAHYRDVQIIGADVATTFGDVGVWAEGAYSIPEDGDSYYQAIIGGDYGFENGLIVMGQFLYAEKPQPGKPENQTTKLLLFGANQSIGLYDWRVGAVYNVDVRSYMLNPEVSVSLADATDLIIGGRYFGNTNGPVGMLPQEQNQVYAQVKVSF